MLLLSGIGKPYDAQAGTGVVGRGYAYQTTSAVQVFFDRIDALNESADERGQAILEALYDYAELIAPELD